MQILIFDIVKRLVQMKGLERIGPDIPHTHWKLHFPRLMRNLCENKFLYFGAQSAFRPGAYAIETKSISIGDRVVIRPGTMLFGFNGLRPASIIIENDVLIGSGVHIYVSNHKFDLCNPVIDQGHLEPRRVMLRRGCWIGANSIILPGVEIGENSVIGAGSVVTKSIPSGVVAAGNPAKIIKVISGKIVDPEIS